MGDERVTRVRQSWAAVDAAAPQVLVRNLPAKGTVDLDSPFFPRSRLACPACAAG